MADVFPKEKRSHIMSRVRGKNTNTEREVRSIIHRMGFRFRLHCKELPGSPDIVLPKLKKIVLVHGCFWHGHSGCTRSARPTSNSEFWNNKLERNAQRDADKLTQLQELGWHVLIVWGCEIKNTEELQARLEAFLHE
jgi:DNA mismatch endonuclease (patch repair protein)